MLASRSRKSNPKLSRTIWSRLAAALQENSTALRMVLLTVVVPDGLLPGDQMSVEAPDGNAYTVEIPPGVAGGQAMEVDLPDGPGPSSSGTQPVEVVVPDGIRAGEAFSVEFGGAVMEIVRKCSFYKK